MQLRGQAEEQPLQRWGPLTQKEEMGPLTQKERHDTQKLKKSFLQIKLLPTTQTVVSLIEEIIYTTCFFLTVA